jgi:hypothetical protein
MVLGLGLTMLLGVVLSPSLTLHIIVLKPGPTRLTWGWNRAGFKEKSVRDLARKNPVDSEG